MSPRREYISRFPCAETGCTERSYYVDTSRREQEQTYASQRKSPWRCIRHTSKDQVLTPDNLERTTVLTAGKSPRYPHLTELFWVNDISGSANGFAHGEGFKAFAKDFPPGTRLIVTARIELPTEAQETEQ